MPAASEAKPLTPTKEEEPKPKAKKSKTRFSVVEEPEGCFRVWDEEEERFVDGPWEEEEPALDRAAKREGRVTNFDPPDTNAPPEE